MSKPKDQGKCATKQNKQQRKKKCQGKGLIARIYKKIKN